MSWSKIIAQERVKSLLQRTILENRIANSYCFWGNSGIGKDALAIEFAKTANCQNPIISATMIEACNECSSCRLTNSLQHPNINFIFSLPTGKLSDTKKESAFASLSDEQLDIVNENLRAKAENPYHKISIPNANQIKITSVREVKRNLLLSQVQSGRRFVIVSNADEMTTEAANAFLKTLEEPHENTTIIITTSKRDAILPTILSRCQQIQCSTLTDEEIETALIERLDYPKNQAKLISAFAQGSFVKAMDFMDEDMQTMRESVIGILRAAVKKKNYRIELLEKIDEASSIKDKKRLEIFLSLLMIWFRDVLSLIVTQTNKKVVNIDQIEVLNKFSSSYSDKNFNLIQEEIEKAIRRIRQNVMPQLILLNMFLNIRKILID